jgi:hypothetical protein
LKTLTKTLDSIIFLQRTYQERKSNVDDIRIIAAVLAIIGVGCGLFLGVPILIIVTLVVVANAIYRVASNKSSGGTSGGLGTFIISVGGAVSFLLPMWITWLIHKLV